MEKLYLHLTQSQFGICMLDMLNISKNECQVYFSYDVSSSSCHISQDPLPCSIYLPFLHSMNCPVRAEQFLCPEKTIKLASSALLTASDGRVLVTRRKETLSFPKAWVFPGGHKDPGESFEIAAQREIEEEVGIAVPLDSLHPLMLYESVFPSNLSLGTPRAHFLIQFFTCHIPIPSRHISVKISTDEIDNFVWISPDDLSAEPSLVIQNTSVHVGQLQGIYPNSIHEGMAEGHLLAFNKRVELL